MTLRNVVRIALGIAIGMGLASLPFLQYGARSHRHAVTVAHTHHH